MVSKGMWNTLILGLRSPKMRVFHISGEFNSQYIANTAVWSYATMGSKPGERLMGLLERQAEAISGDFNSQGLARLGYCNIGQEARQAIDDTVGGSGAVDVHGGQESACGVAVVGLRRSWHPANGRHEEYVAMQIDEHGTGADNCTARSAVVVCCQRKDMHPTRYSHVGVPEAKDIRIDWAVQRRRIANSEMV
jgi:hypothetical protein